MVVRQTVGKGSGLPFLVPASIILLALVALLTYLPVLDNGFYDIDDQRHVANGAGAPFPNEYFRVGQEWSFRVLWWLAGTNPFPYYISGLSFHFVAAVLVMLLATRVLQSRLLGLVGGLIFVTNNAPNQAVMWIGAHLGVQAVAFVLAALLLWLRFLRTGGWLSWGGAFICGFLGMCFKESGVHLLPFMLVLHLWARGPLDLSRPRSILAWLPFLLLAMVITWRAIALPGGIGLVVQPVGPIALGDRLLRSLGHLLLPINFRRYLPGLSLLGLALVILPFVGAWFVRRTSRGHESALPAAKWPVAAVGVAMVLAGHLAYLPVNGEITGERNYYDAIPGLAILLAAGFAQMQTCLGRWSRLRAIPWILLFLWLGANVMAVHRVEGWRYDLASRRVERVVAGAEKALAEIPADQAILFLDPPMKDLRDFQFILQVWLQVPAEKMRRIGYLPKNEEFGRRLREKPGEIALRWSPGLGVWIPFAPGGSDWLQKWKPVWTPGSLDDPNLSPLLRCLEVDSRK